ncbi:unnamed protein product [Ectocarpus sp. 13 AM-2016]
MRRLLGVGHFHVTNVLLELCFFFGVFSLVRSLLVLSLGIECHQVDGLRAVVEAAVSQHTEKLVHSCSSFPCASTRKNSARSSTESLNMLHASQIALFLRRTV